MIYILTIMCWKKDLEQTHGNVRIKLKTLGANKLT